MPFLVTTSAEDGGFGFDKIAIRAWIVREIEQPEGLSYVGSLFSVGKRDGQVVTLKITNEFIVGSIHLTKYDADYPDHKLSGAEFEVYLDNNGNKKR